MHPILWKADLLGGHLTIKSYTSFLVLAAIAMIAVGAFVARRRGLDGKKSAACLLIGLVATMIGARLAHWVTNPNSFDGLGAVLSLGRSNLSVYAGLLLGLPAAALCARRTRMNAWRLADSAAPALALGAVLAKTGCLLNGCCFGLPTRLPWGIVPSGDAHIAQIAAGDIGLFDSPLPVHPTQLYEILAALAAGLVALWLLRRKSADGKAFLAFAVLFTALRWANLRCLWIPSSSALSHRFYPTLYALVLALCLFAYGRIEIAVRSGGYAPASANTNLAREEVLQ